MLIHVIAELFKYKLVGSILVLTCWPYSDRVKLARELFKFDIPATFSCGTEFFEKAKTNDVQGVLYIPSNNLINQVKSKYFRNWYKWIIVDGNLPNITKPLRYDSDISFIRATFDNSLIYKGTENADNNSSDLTLYDMTQIHDVYYHPKDGVSIHPWAVWNSKYGIQIVHERERILRRQNLNRHSLRIATPLGAYSEDVYNYTFLEYLTDMSIREQDSGVRVGYFTSSLIIERLNGTEILLPTILWGAEVHNSSMVLELIHDSSQLSGGILRILPERFEKLDYVIPIWPFNVGFTYLAERESSSNMFMEPFTATCWWCTLGLFLILALAQRITAKSPMEKEGAYVATLATYLQQDASAVPEGISGRWTFLVLSISAMLIHAYYTSAIVSALMSAGRSGPDSLRTLGDSKYSIASIDYDYMRYLMFDMDSNRDDLEYLKKKKMTSNFYHDIDTGVQLIQDGQTAYHAEYNQLYPYMKTFSDDQLCKLQYVDTIPEILTWITTTKHGQWKEIFRIAGAWLLETGLGRRLVSRIRIRQPPCRAALLAERVNIDDIAPVLILTLAGAITSLILLGLEFLYAKWRGNNAPISLSDDTED